MRVLGLLGRAPSLRGEAKQSRAGSRIIVAFALDRLALLAMTAAKPASSLSDYLLGQIREVVARPTQEEMIERLRKLPAIQPSIDPVDIIRDYRDRE